MKLLKNISIRRAAVTPALGVLLGGLVSLSVGTAASASEAGYGQAQRLLLSGF